MPLCSDGRQAPVRPTSFRTRCCSRILLLFGLIVSTLLARAQDNYEIQVYGSETVPAGQNMVELHSNYTFDGPRASGGVLPDRHAFHETLEFTHGFTPWFETGFYVFSSIQPGRGWEWVGDHIRPRIRVPESWHWPVGLSLSTEIGYQRALYSEDTWTWEVRPIIDRQFGRLYLAINPTFGLALKGPNSHRGWDFGPSYKISYDVTKKVAAGLEYYSSYGPFLDFDPGHEQEQLLMPAIDLNISPLWEINFGLGFGLTTGTDDVVAKFILGRRF